ncbi:MAG TPA: response regulator [Thermoanaerobaculia bacterium]|nr:response regulator [Thermoanaerobaculia bacterium]
MSKQSPSEDASLAPNAPLPGVRWSLKTRLKVTAFVGVAIVAAWLYYTVNQVLTLHDVTLDIQRATDLRERVGDAKNALAEAVDSLDRYTQNGEGYDHARHHAGRTTLRAALGAIRRRVMTESTRGALERAEAAEELFSKAADRAIALWAPGSPSAAREHRDNVAEPAAAALRDVLSDLENRFGRVESLAEGRLKGARDSATASLVILAALIVAGVLWLLTDVERRILSPTVAATRALGELASDRPPPRLAEVSGDEIGELGRQFNRAAVSYADRVRALGERDIQASVNAVLAAAATVNDLKGFGSKVLETVLEVSGASSAVLYLPQAVGSFAPAQAVGWSRSEGDEVGAAKARRVAEEKRSLFLSIDPQTPTVDVFDGRILPRESVHIPLIYFDHVVGVLALGAAQPFTVGARNVLSAIAPSLAVALANASANERVAEQTRRLAEQNELLEEQRSRIARTNLELQRASALKDRFLASVSHELRTPMTVILGFTAALLKGGQGNLNAQQRESLERVQRNAKLLLGLINDVLDISKIESGKVEIERQTVFPAALARQIEADYGEAARSKGLKLVAEAASGLHSVTSDPARVLQIVSNLVGNALKFTEKGSITVRFEPREEDRWAIVVADTGIGIPEDEQGAIFDEFRQGEAVEHRGRGGTGLGLAIVKKLAAVLGGTVSLESSRGKGSRFTVVLPRELPRKTPVVVPESQPAAWPVPATPQRSVLVVDDDEGVRRLLAYELQPLGVTVLEAADGKSALEIASTRAPDVILLDVLMPGLDGWETLRGLKENPATRGIPVVVLSVLENRAFGLSLGAFDYLVKPVEMPQLVDTLSRAGVLASRGRLLVVDDDPDVRELLARGCISAGYRVQSVAGGAEALDAMSQDPPSAVILDLMMRPPDGFEVLWRMREDPALRAIPVLIVTAKDLTATEYAQLSGSAQRVIRKASDPARLVAEVLRAVQEEKTA